MAGRDPIGSYSFKVVMQGVEGYFQEVSGLSAQIEVIEVQEGGHNTTTRKLVGHGKYPNIVFKRGFFTGELFGEFNKFLTGKQRFSGVIILQDNERNAVKQWTFTRGFPTKWDGPQMNVSQNAIAVESLEIAHEGLS